MWLAVDPLAEKYPEWSPYHYAFSNPMRYIDPRGLEGENQTEDRPWWKRMSDVLFGGPVREKIAQLGVDLGKFIENATGSSSTGGTLQPKTEEQVSAEQSANQGPTNQDVTQYQFRAVENYVTTTAKGQLFATATLFAGISTMETLGALSMSPAVAGQFYTSSFVFSTSSTIVSASNDLAYGGGLTTPTQISMVSGPISFFVANPLRSAVIGLTPTFYQWDSMLFKTK